MAMIQKLNGWNVHVERRTWKQDDEEGQPGEIKGHALVFTEAHPPTGNTIVYEFSERVKDYLVSELTGVIVPGLHVPQL